uniref:Uncharacterized protein n=1 Tax=Picea glauca TaxID=3330 RepID=A0A117NFT7_PICGL|nr:hypothetical protein ABT39_MTgene2323 [Picea glauca]QHR89302.1 hypothetical protein Q903MT_gene3323 [Picea sitchensis]
MLLALDQKGLGHYLDMDLHLEHTEHLHPAGGLFIWITRTSIRISLTNIRIFSSLTKVWITKVRNC